jgi:hypothetical protein
VTLQEFVEGVAVSRDYTSRGLSGEIKWDGEFLARYAAAGGSGGCGGLCYVLEGRGSKTYPQRDEGFLLHYPGFF